MVKECGAYGIKYSIEIRNILRTLHFRSINWKKKHFFSFYLFRLLFLLVLYWFDLVLFALTLLIHCELFFFQNGLRKCKIDCLSFSMCLCAFFLILFCCLLFIFVKAHFVKADNKLPLISVQKYILLCPDLMRLTIHTKYEKKWASSIDTHSNCMYYFFAVYFLLFCIVGICLAHWKYFTFSFFFSFAFRFYFFFIFLSFCSSAINIL